MSECSFENSKIFLYMCLKKNEHISNLSNILRFMEQIVHVLLYFFSFPRESLLLKKIKSEFEIFFLPFFFFYHSTQFIYFLLSTINFILGYLYLFLILFVLFQFVFPILLPLFHVQNCLSAFWFFSTFYFPFVDSLVLLFCCQSQNECETSVSCEFTLFCTFFFYVFVCYKLSWFINPSRLFKGFCITKNEK